MTDSQPPRARAENPSVEPPTEQDLQDASQARALRIAQIQIQALSRRLEVVERKMMVHRY
jgi:hypothetical protein